MKREKLFDANSIVVTEDTFEFDTVLEYEDILLCISKAIYNYRKQNNLTQQQLAELLDVKQEMISKLERGYYNPTMKMLHQISRKLTHSTELFIDILKSIIIELNNIYINCYDTNTNNEQYKKTSSINKINLEKRTYRENLQSIKGGNLYNEQEQYSAISIAG